MTIPPNSTHSLVQPPARRRIGHRRKQTGTPSTCCGNARGWLRSHHHGHWPCRCDPRCPEEGGTYTGGYGSHRGTLLTAPSADFTGTDIAPQMLCNPDQRPLGQAVFSCNPPETRGSRGSFKQIFPSAPAVCFGWVHFAKAIEKCKLASSPTVAKT